MFFSNGKHKQSIIISTFKTKSREFEIHYYDENIKYLNEVKKSNTVTIRFILDSGS